MLNDKWKINFNGHRFSASRCVDKDIFDKPLMFLNAQKSRY